MEVVFCMIDNARHQQAADSMASDVGVDVEMSNSAHLCILKVRVSIQATYPHQSLSEACLEQGLPRGREPVCPAPPVRAQALDSKEALP